MEYVKTESAESDLTAQMKHRIEQRTNERIHGLNVREIGGKVVLSGRASSYYILQLALAAARELAGSATLEIHVDVCPPEAPRVCDSDEPAKEDVPRETL